ncbi:hypothetical protein SODALDRAFT_268108 [Sodiomyces alkalinus F11]|uniref:SET domain-containing protein n=1 Tax=Sodiomyces alkalinus (strain CBS 110278 / VKM F-3762 / F11) TaxID=1314773 RepID=A0A3N2Q6G0_SODAK|nr:hypothetical protein SODALDRAFT_268108 [Sodiomyces alkalinus F11]ROT42296.1 hypothetical protein SODALDRAFT_268108 [Sodiomyces alkalinus F11]
MGKKSTPRKAWTVERLTEALEQRSREMKGSHRDLVAFTLKSAKPVERRIMTGQDWFAGLKCDPVPAEEPKDDSMFKIKVKHHIRGKKDQRVFHFRVICIKTDKPRVPQYRFHHKEIARNVLTPNTMLKFVPHIRDLDPSEEREYNVWLKQLERMDASCGFKPMGTREQRVIRTTKKERTAMVALYLPDWLEKLAIDGCTRSTLIRHMVDTGSDIDMTPQQKSSLYQLHSDNDPVSISPRTGRIAAMFTEAFNRVFHDSAPPDRAITLKDILMLDKGVDDIVEAKKTAKNATQEDAVKPDDPQTFLETYSIMGCLICFSNSCEHGDYGVNNEKRNFSLDCNGQLEQPLAKSKAAMEKRDRDETVIEPCYRDCFMTHGPADHGGSRPWTSDEEMVLKTLFSVVECSSRVTSKPECMAAEILDRRCWDVRRQLVELDVSVPEDDSPNASLPQAKVLPWYDRHRKVLIGDWQDHTKTHDHKSRVLTEPCHHEGPCTLANGCDCVANGLLCERFCRCTVENCSYKFTGCACSGTGKTCQQRQCICVQLNRECDPMLCGSCGVGERTLPKNRENDELMETGCQNCYLQRGRSKALAPGKSLLDGCGYGLFALEDIAQHEFVIEYTGELVMHDEGVRREARRGEAFDKGSFTSYVFSLLDAEGIWVDAAIYGNHSRYINHAQDAYNLEPKIVYVGGEYRIRFTAIRNIQAGEELFFNYGDSFPNLTKKMIKDKTSEDDARAAEGSPSRKEKARSRPGGKGAGKPRKREKEKEKEKKERGREGEKPGARKEAPPTAMDDLGELTELTEPPARTRKRRRRVGEPEEDEGAEYHPSQEESEGRAGSTGSPVLPHRRRARRRLRSPSAGSADVDRPELPAARPDKDGQGEAPKSLASTSQAPSTPSPRARRRGRPPRPRHEGVASPETKTTLQRPPGQGHQRGRLAFDSENPNGPREVNGEADRSSLSSRMRRGRRRIAEDSDDDGTGRPRTADSTLEVDDSYDSQLGAPPSVSRSNRPRKRPARYREEDA